ncbi:MAG TPA: serine hydrolase [Solirubrobacterales bacterium]
MKRLLATAFALLVLIVPATAPAAAPGEYPWAKRLEIAKRFAASRTGKVSIGIVDQDRHFHGYGSNRRYNSASVVKVMLMVAYLRHGNQNHQPLTPGDKALLGPMITRSDNAAATRVRDIVGNEGLVRLANEAGMTRFAPNVVWGLSQITARDQANWAFEIERYIPKRHREYAMNLLARIIPRQSWGIPPATPQGYTIHFKGGWAPSGNPGWTVNQVAQLDSSGGGDRFSLAILTRGSPSKDYGIATIRGVAQKLMKKLPG